jgi:formate--tetrahydrofolate ligase
MGVAFAINEAFMKGGEGCMELAQAITDMIDNNPSDHIEYVYSLDEKVEDKISRVAQEIYRADKVLFKPTAKRKLEQIKEWGFENLPVCIAKTQYSFTDDAKIMGAPEHFNITIRDVELNAGAGMIVAIAGEMLRMPGLPKSPQAERIDVVDGVLTGLS